MAACKLCHFYQYKETASHCWRWVASGAANAPPGAFKSRSPTWRQCYCDLGGKGQRKGTKKTTFGHSVLIWQNQKRVPESRLAFTVVCQDRLRWRRRLIGRMRTSPREVASILKNRNKYVFYFPHGDCEPDQEGSDQCRLISTKATSVTRRASRKYLRSDWMKVLR